MDKPDPYRNVQTQEQAFEMIDWLTAEISQAYAKRYLRYAIESAVWSLNKHLDREVVREWVTAWREKRCAEHGVEKEVDE